MNEREYKIAILILYIEDMIVANKYELISYI